MDKNLIRKLIMAFGFGVLVIVLLTGLGLVYGASYELVVIAPFARETIDQNRSLYRQGEDVASLYGTRVDPDGKKQVFIFPPKERIIRTYEDTSLLLIPKQYAEDVMTDDSVWSMIYFIGPLFLVIGIIGLLMPKEEPVVEEKPYSR